MSFVDKVQVVFKAGRGGDGKLSFRREKFIAKGGPDGGDGGHGGNIIVAASRNQNTLTAFRYQKEIKAEAGKGGGRKRQHGKNGQDSLVDVPVGTLVIASSGQVLADLVSDGQNAVIANGGLGGFGNAHFVSSRRQAPNFAEKGEPGDSLEATLELKMIADVGLVGLPNAGKSTLLAKLSNAHPEVANYPFTTLTPSLGVVDIDKTTAVLMADIPGLIEGAAKGKGLGHDFLRHIERTAVILHLIDAYTEDVAKAYLTVRNELKAYQPELVKRPEIIGLTKTEGLDTDITRDLTRQLKQVAKTTPIYPISAHSGAGLPALLYAVKDVVAATKVKPKPRTKKPDVPVLRLPEQGKRWQIKKVNQGFIVVGPRIEQFARRTDFSNDEALTRLKDIMRKQGILHELKRRGLNSGDTIQIGDDARQSFSY